MKRDLFTTILIALAVTVNLSAFVYVGYGYNKLNGHGGTNDLAVFQVAGNSIIGNSTLEPAELYTKKKMRPAVRALNPVGGTLYLYSPAAALALVPFAGNNLNLTGAIWAFCNALLFVGTFYFVIHFLLKDSKWYRPQYTIALAALAVSGPVTSVARTGQIDMLMWTLFVLATIGIVYKKPKLTGVVLGVTAVMKLFPLLFLPYLIFRRRWQASIVMVTTISMFIIASVPFFGWNGWSTYLSERLPAIAKSTIGTTWKSESLYGSVRAGIRQGSYEWISPVNRELNSILNSGYSWFVLLCLIGVGVMIWRSTLLSSRTPHRQSKPVNTLLHMGILLILVMLVAKIVHAQYSIWAIPLILYFIALPRSAATKWSWVAYQTLGWLSILLLSFSHLGLPFLIGDIIKPITAATLILFITTLVRMWGINRVALKPDMLDNTSK